MSKFLLEAIISANVFWRVIVIVIVIVIRTEQSKGRKEAMASRYWAVSLPVHNSATALWSQLQERISKHSFDTPLYRFNIPNLRVGTLDSLLSLSDDLAKSNNFVEGVTHKIRRQIEELERASGVNSGGLTVDGVPVDSYLTRFVWDEAKYPTVAPLKEIVDGIHSQVAKIEDDLKVRASEYNNIRSQLNAINRKQTGSLAVRDLSNLVKPEDIITSEHLTTLLAIVSKYSQKDWLSSYETLTSYVVPRSSKKLYEDNEYALYTVTLFNRVADNFRTSAREKGFQIRDFEYSPETHENRKQELDQLIQDQERLKASLLQWCYTSYGEVFSSWMHFCAVRLFAESILRYGLPPSFLACVLAPSVKSEKKVRSILEGLSDSTNRQGEDEVGAGMAGLAGDSDAHPYVSFTINVA
ncbi:V-type proton ATPase subunit C, partial [Mucuna pruriens]